MKWLLDKIESSPIPQKLMRLQTEGNRINDLVNEVKIEDKGSISRNWRWTSCRKMRF